MDLDQPAMEDDINESSVQRLMRAWTDERHSPDLLAFQTNLLDELLQKLHEQNVMVTTLQNDTETTEEEHLRLTLVKTDMERVKFIVRSYLRVRLHKIEKYAPFIMATPEMQAKLSSAEHMHAQKYLGVLASHFHASVLDALPESTHALDQSFGDGTTMITEPDKDRAVFIHARATIPQVLLPDGDTIDIAYGSIHLLRYRTIEKLLERGQVNLV